MKDTTDGTSAALSTPELTDNRNFFEKLPDFTFNLKYWDST